MKKVPAGITVGTETVLYSVRGVLRIFLFERVAGAERLCDCLAEDNIGVVERVEGYRLRL